MPGGRRIGARRATLEARARAHRRRPSAHPLSPPPPPLARSPPRAAHPPARAPARARAQFCYTICTFAAAAGSTSQAYGFLVIWSMMLTLALAAAGTMVLRRPDYRTHLAVGALIGTSAMQANLMLIVAVISGANMNKGTAGAGSATPPSFTATETFAAMLFMAFTTFTVFVFSWCVALSARASLTRAPCAQGAPGLALLEATALSAARRGAAALASALARSR